MSAFLFSSSPAGKRSKHSRSPTPAGRHDHQEQQQQQQIQSPEATPLRSRGRGAALLPLTTHDTSTTPTTRRLRPRGGTHNKFLAGGMNVDHKLKRTRRRQPRRNYDYYNCYGIIRHHPRRAVVGGLAAILLFVIIWHEVVPAGTRTLLFHSSSNSYRLPPITDPSIHLPPIEYTRALIAEREKQRRSSSSSSSSRESSSYSTARRAILERLAPAWFHRNDPDYHSDQAQKTTATAAAAAGDEKDGTAQEEEKEVIVANQQQEEKKLSGGPDEALPTLPEQHHHDTEDIQSPPLPLPALHRQLRTLDNMDDYPISSACATTSLEDETTTTPLSVTLVIQTSPDRLWILQETCQRWSSHPIVVVVAVDHADDGAGSGGGEGGGEASSSTAAMISAAQTACGAHLDLVVHRLLEDDNPSSPYPVNVLRNLGLDRVRTSHVLVSDIDFVPSLHLDDTILHYVQHRADHDALVVPAFQRVLKPPCTTADECQHHLASNSSFLPRTFEELQQCVHERNECIVFQDDNNWEGHSSTGSKQWLERKFFETNNDEKPTTTTTTTPRQLHCFDSLRYEPYVVLRWCPAPSATTTSQQRPVVAPYYDERFHGYGKNKIQLIAHLRLLGYQFFVLPEGFIVHNPHVPSSSKRQWENQHQSTLHHDMDRLYESFLQALVNKYYQQHQGEIVGQCHHQQQDNKRHLS
jgi:Glycosyl-transferase for dystroglycan